MRKTYFTVVSILILFAFTAKQAIAFQQPDTLVTTDSIDLARQADSVRNIADIPINVFWEQPDTTSQTEQTENTAQNPLDVFREAVSGWKIFQAIVIFLLGYILILSAVRFLYFLAERNTRYRSTIRGFVPILRIFAWILIGYIVIAGVLKPEPGAIFALGASVGVAIGFAAQDVLKNIFGGIMILIDRPFIVGDKIEIGSHYGEVVEIGLRSTRIVTPDDSLVSVPNSEVMNSAVSNANAGEDNCQVVAEIYLPIDVDTERVRTIALEAAKVSSYVYLNKPIVVLFINEMKDHRSYLKMRLKAYVMNLSHEFAFKSDMTEIVVRELLKEGIISREFSTE